LGDAAAQVVAVRPLDAYGWRGARERLDALQRLRIALLRQLELPSLSQYVRQVVVELDEFHRVLAVARLLARQALVDGHGPRVEFLRLVRAGFRHHGAE